MQRDGSWLDYFPHIHNKVLAEENWKKKKRKRQTISFSSKKRPSDKDWEILQTVLCVSVRKQWSRLKYDPAVCFQADVPLILVDLHALWSPKSEEGQTQKLVRMLEGKKKTWHSIPKCLWRDHTHTPLTRGMAHSSANKACSGNFHCKLQHISTL